MRRTIRTEQEFFTLLEAGISVWCEQRVVPVSAKGWLATRDMAHLNPASRATLQYLTLDFLPRGIYYTEVE